jgi:hypothetical protein
MEVTQWPWQRDMPAIQILILILILVLQLFQLRKVKKRVGEGKNGRGWVRVCTRGMSKIHRYRVAINTCRRSVSMPQILLTLCLTDETRYADLILSQ